MSAPRHEPPTAFELESWRKEALTKITCTGCFGTGQRYRHDRAKDDGRYELCERCQGSAVCAAEPHVVRLVDEVRRLQVALESCEAAWFKCHDGSEEGCWKAHEE